MSDVIFRPDILFRPTEINWGHPFLVLSSSGVMATSQDGVEWEKVEDYFGPVLTIGAFGKGVFLAARANPAQLMWSTSGHEWEPVPGHPFTGGVLIKDIVFGNDRFLVTCVDIATQRTVQAAIMLMNQDKLWVWSNLFSPPLTGGNMNYAGAGFSHGQFFIFGAELFSGMFQDVIAYDFALGQPTFSSPYTAIWTSGRLARSINGFSWSSLEDPFISLANGGFAETITITNPAPPHNTVQIPRTFPDVSQVSTNVSYMVSRGPETGPVVVAQVTNVPGNSFASYSNGSWSVSSSSMRNVTGGLAYGAVLLPDEETPIDRWVAMGTDLEANFGYLTSDSGTSWQFTRPGALPVGSGMRPVVFGKNKFVTVRGSLIYYSARGTFWTITGGSLGASNFSTVVY